MQIINCWALIGRDEITATPFDKLYFRNEYDAKQTVRETYSKIAEVKEDDLNHMRVYQNNKMIAFFIVKREKIKIHHQFTHL